MKTFFRKGRDREGLERERRERGGVWAKRGGVWGKRLRGWEGKEEGGVGKGEGRDHCV